MKLFQDKLNFDTLPVVLNKVKFYFYKGDKYKWNSITFPPKYSSENDYAKAGYVVNESKICFSSFNRQLNPKKSFNRVIFLFEKSKCIKKGEMARWLRLCKKNNFLPRYASIGKIMKHKGIVLDLEKHSRNLLYVYLTVCRFPQEDPCMVRNTLILCEEFNMDFYAALAFATQIRMNNMGHHFLPGTSPYMKPENVEDLKGTRLAHIVGLYRFMKKDGPQLGDKTSFNANSSVGSMCDVVYKLKPEDLLHPDFPEIIRAETDKKVKALLKKAKIGE